MNMFFGGNAVFANGGPGQFDRDFKCFPPTFMPDLSRSDQLEQGDKIVMPPSALHRLASLRISYPMMFRLTNPLNGKIVHCGVLEFIADEGHCFVPYWLMNYLQVEEGQLINITNATLPKGTSVTFQPQSSDFNKLANPRAVLETALRTFSALTNGQTIQIYFNNRPYCLDVVDVNGQGGTNHGGVSIVETDMVVDFAPPRDFKRFAEYDEDDPFPSSSESEGEGDEGGEGESAPGRAAYAGMGFTVATGKKIGTPLAELQKREAEEKARKEEAKAQRERREQARREEIKAKEDQKQPDDDKSFQAFGGEGRKLR